MVKLLVMGRLEALCLPSNQPCKISASDPVTQISFCEKNRLLYGTKTQTCLVICNVLLTLPTSVDIAPQIAFSWASLKTNEHVRKCRGSSVERKNNQNTKKGNRLHSSSLNSQTVPPDENTDTGWLAPIKHDGRFPAVFLSVGAGSLGHDMAGAMAWMWRKYFIFPLYPHIALLNILKSHFMQAFIFPINSHVFITCS